MRLPRPLFVCLTKIILSFEDDGRPWALVKLGIKQEQPQAESEVTWVMFGSIVVITLNMTLTAPMFYNRSCHNPYPSEDLVRYGQGHKKL